MPGLTRGGAPTGGPKDRYSATAERKAAMARMAESREGYLREMREYAEDRKRPYEGEGDCHLCDRPLEGHTVKWWNKAKNQLVHTECARKLA